MLLNDFYTVRDLRQGNDTVSCLIVFNGEHDIFKGHFPSQPVVPGVCMIRIVKDLLEQHLNKKLLLRSTGQVKFLQLITPDVTPEAHLSWKPQESGYLVNATLKQGADLFKLSGIFETIQAAPAGKLSF